MVKIRGLISNVQRDFPLKRNRYVPNHVLHSVVHIQLSLDLRFLALCQII